MKNRDAFVRERAAAWQELERLLQSTKELGGRDVSRLGALYRTLASDLMAARGARYGADLLQHLDVLAAKAHTRLYGHGRRGWQVGWSLVLHDFPRHLRANAGFMLVSAALFCLPLLLGILSTALSPEFAQAVLPPESLQQMADMYQGGVSGGRDVGTDAGMAGFYVHNNVGIAFRCFATGILFGLGSAFFLVYNGLTIGVVVAHVTRMGHGEHILTFMSGHAAYELGAIVISGAAGLRLGYSLVATGGLARLDSLRLNAQATVPLICGAGGMLLLAAAIEAFWSPSRAPYGLKWAFGVLSFGLVFWFFSFAARPGRASARVHALPFRATARKNSPGGGEGT